MTKLKGQIHILKFRPEELVDYSDALSFFPGLNEDAEYYDDMKDFLDKAFEVGWPKAVYRESFVGEIGDKRAKLGGVYFKGPLAAEMLGKVHKAFPYVASCGSELDALAASYRATDPLLNYYADVFNQNLADLMSGKVKEDIALRYGIEQVSSINPGSLPTFHIREQAPLFKLLEPGPDQIGVRLTDSYLMLPVKSVSGILYPASQEWFSCMRCARKNCPGRRAEFAAEFLPCTDESGVLK